MTVTVHHLNNSRSQRILWLLEELNTDYDIVPYQRDAETNLAPPELKQVHPLGKSPLIEDNGLQVAESGAIIQYLCERHGGGSWLPELIRKTMSAISNGCSLAKAALGCGSCSYGCSRQSRNLAARLLCRLQAK